MNRVLLVDDEQNVINALRRELQGDYEIEAFVSPREALQRCQDARFDLVIADYRMPEMDGVEFLKHFGLLQPDAVRLMLSGHADFNALIGTVNEVHVYRFIDKPWDRTGLAATLAEALAHREQILENHRLAEHYRRQRRWQPPQIRDRLYQVLIVDDEPNILNTIARDLSARGGWADLHAAMLYQADPSLPLARSDLHFSIFTTTSPIQALEQAKKTHYDVVISDYLMPEMDGLHFLEAFRKMQPDAARILLSGYADKDALVNAINHSEIYGYISKPWLGYILKSTVSQAISYHDLQRENRQLAQAGLD